MNKVKSSSSVLNASAWLYARHGEVMTAREVRDLFKLKTAAAFSMARSRGHLKLNVLRFPGRRELFFRTLEVAAQLERFTLSETRK